MVKYIWFISTILSNSIRKNYLTLRNNLLEFLWKYLEVWSQTRLCPRFSKTLSKCDGSRDILQPPSIKSFCSKENKSLVFHSHIPPIHIRFLHALISFRTLSSLSLMKPISSHPILISWRKVNGFSTKISSKSWSAITIFHKNSFSRPMASFTNSFHSWYDSMCHSLQTFRFWNSFLENLIKRFLKVKVFLLNI